MLSKLKNIVFVLVLALCFKTKAQQNIVLDGSFEANKKCDAALSVFGIYPQIDYYRRISPQHCIKQN